MISTELGREAVTLTDIAEVSGLPLWRWMPRMHAIDENGDGWTVLEVDETRLLVQHGRRGVAWVSDASFIPDFADAPTRGGLLQLVRDAYGDETLTPEHRAKNGEWRVFPAGMENQRRWTHRLRGRCTEAEALLAALRSAPRRAVPQ